MAVTLNASASAGFVTTADTSTILQLQTAGTAAVTVDASQNVAIGTASPAAKLTVNGDIFVGYYSAGQTITVLNGDTTNRQRIQMRMSGTDGILETTRNSGTVANMIFGIDQVEKMRLDTNGNLGIGTSSPAYKLDVSGAGARIANTGVAELITSSSGGGGNWEFGVDASGNGFIYSGQAKYLAISTNASERIRITSGGYVGVGEGSPEGYAPFVVAKPAINVNYGQIVARSTAAGDVSTAGMSVSKTDTTTTTSQIFFKFIIGNGASGSGQINANGANAAAFGSYSDSRLKENIVDLPSQLDNIMALRPVEYDYIESEGGGHQIGFVAQEVQAIYPDLVGERPDGMLTLADMNKNDARLIKAIQEMKAIIDTQASTITQLQADVAALKGAQS